MRKVNMTILGLITPYLRSGILILEKGERHTKVRNPSSLDFLPLSGSPSDHRAFNNFAADLRRLVERGEGFIHRKTGRLPLAGDRQYAL